MQPLQDLLHRIRWDSKFAQGVFALGYVDRVAHEERVVPLTTVTFDSQSPGMFSVQDDEGVASQIPLHWVRTVYKDGKVIWHRSSRP